MNEFDSDNLLLATLNSIGDAVILTDTDSRVTFLNPVAERLTGWCQAEAVGKPLDRVFRLVKADARKPLENPTDRALRADEPVELPEHTLLIAKDGAETAIDDSAAPIKYAQGDVAGAVIVFRDVSGQAAGPAGFARLSRAPGTGGQCQRHRPVVLRSAIRQARVVRAGEAALRSARRLRGDDRRLLSTTTSRRSGENAAGDRALYRRACELRYRISHRGSGRARALDTRDRTSLLRLRRRAGKIRRHHARYPRAGATSGVVATERSAVSHPCEFYPAAGVDGAARRLYFLVQPALVRLYGHPPYTGAGLGLAMCSRSRTAAPGHEEHQAQFCLRRAMGGHLSAASLRWRNALAFEPYAAGERRPGPTDAVVLTVKDTGIGIPAARLTRIFDMFAQVDGSLQRSRSGLGIGLTLVKRLVEMHGGTVEAHSSGPGAGSEFIVRLPLGADIDARAPDSVANAVISGTIKHRILVVDDNRDAATALAAILTVLGYDARSAFDGADALMQATVFRPEVVLLDLRMPRLNGFETAERLRAQAGGQSLVLIALTGYGQEKDRRRTAAAGFDHHWIKPVDPAMLETMLAGVTQAIR